MVDVKKTTVWTDEAVQELMWNILDVLKEMDKDAVKSWVKENWPDQAELYS